MSAPPGIALNTQNGITGTRTKAEIRRELADKYNAAARRRGETLLGWQVRWLLNSADDHDVPTDEEATLRLMAAPWIRNRPTRKWKIGEGGGWAVKSS